MSPTSQRADATMFINRTIEVRSVPPRMARNAQDGILTGCGSMKTSLRERVWTRITVATRLIMNLFQFPKIVGRGATLRPRFLMNTANPDFRTATFQNAIPARACLNAIDPTYRNAAAPASFRRTNAAIEMKDKKSIVSVGADI